MPPKSKALKEMLSINKESCHLHFTFGPGNYSDGEDIDKLFRKKPRSNPDNANAVIIIPVVLVNFYAIYFVK